jgi:hypothetical protein
VGGGNSNVAGATGGTISGGELNRIEGEEEVNSEYGTISGGYSNYIKGPYGSVGGGIENIIESEEGATIGGGQGNLARGVYGTVAGGQANSAKGNWSTVAGGENNIVENEYSSIGGGSSNIIEGAFSVIPGGYQNSAAGNYSFAAGRRAHANYENTFVWNGDENPLTDFTSTGPNQFLINAPGGVGIGINANPPQGQLTVDGDANISGNLGIGCLPPSGSTRLQIQNGEVAITALPGEMALSAYGNANIIGKLGVGTQIPSEEFEVVGTAKMTGFDMPTSAGAGKVLTSDADGIGNWQDIPYDSPWMMSGSDIYYNGGNVGIGTTSPETKLHVAEGAIRTKNLDPGFRGTDYHFMNFGEGAGSWGGFMYTINDVGFGNGDDFTLFTYAGRDLVLRPEGSGQVHLLGGNVGIGTTSPNAKLHVAGGAVRTQYFDPGFRFPEYEYTRFGTNSEYWAGFMHNISNASFGNGDDFTLFTYGGRDLVLRPQGGQVHMLGGNVGIGTTNPADKLDIKGKMIVGGEGEQGRITIKDTDNTDIAIIGKGFDYAETFSTLYDELEPGTVMIIDPENPGNLCVSRSAYDNKVAGIVAGAGGLSSGVMLGKAGVDGEHPIALAGRVYCRVDARYGAVEPGDLLTTSPTPGCAMAISDYNKAQGAIIGKAMQALPEGETGSILVLVTLQ